MVDTTRRRGFRSRLLASAWVLTALRWKGVSRLKALGDVWGAFEVRWWGWGKRTPAMLLNEWGHQEGFLWEDYDDRRSYQYY